MSGHCRDCGHDLCECPKQDVLAEGDEWCRLNDGDDTEDRRDIENLIRALITRCREAEEKLSRNRCNAGHETLPLQLWDCPECHNITRAERDHFKTDLAVNTTMLARQCDLARHAENERDRLIATARRHKADFDTAIRWGYGDGWDARDAFEKGRNFESPDASVARYWAERGKGTDND